MLSVPRWWEGHIDLNRKTLSVSLPAYYRMVTSVMMMVKLVSQMVVRLHEIENSGKIKVLSATVEQGGECQVCGTELSGIIISCKRCNTPHHEDCWTYMERCSTFGCAEPVIRIQSA